MCMTRENSANLDMQYPIQNTHQAVIQYIVKKRCQISSIAKILLCSPSVSDKMFISERSMYTNRFKSAPSSVRLALSSINERECAHASLGGHFHSSPFYSLCT